MGRPILALAAACLVLPCCRPESRDLPEQPWAGRGAAGPAGVAAGPSTMRSEGPIHGKARTPYTLKAGKKASLALYALEGEPVVPDWGAAGSDPSAARDDDLLTAWTCTQSDGSRPCVLGLALPEEAEVHIIMLFPGAAASREEFEAHARIRSVRIHTDAGWADTRIKRGWDHRHVILPAGIRTRSIAIEVTGIRAGSTDRAVHLPEIEVYGITGRQRAGLEIEPRAAIVRFESGMWNDVEPGPGKEADTSAAAESFVELADGKGGARRIVRGTGLHGIPGDRFFLVERTASVLCPPGSPHTPSGSFTLVDTRTRLMWDVGQLGGVMSTIFRHPAGTGFATSRQDGSRVTPAGGVLVSGKLFRMLRDKSREFTSSSGVEEWGFEDEGAPCCPAADETQWEEICRPLGIEKARRLLGGQEGTEWEELWQTAETGAGEWLECGVSATLGVIALRSPGCAGRRSMLATVDASGRVVDHLIASRIRLGASFVHRRLLEAVSGDGSSIHRIADGGALEEAYPGAAFSLPLPPLCSCPES